MNRTVILLGLLWMSVCGSAQDDLLDELTQEAAEEIDNRVFATFKSPYLINAQTVEMVKPKTLDFRITHRFGNILGDNGGGHTLWGFDQATNIRFSFDYGVTENLSVGFGRSKTRQNLDGTVKYRILHQTNDWKIPISLVYFGSMTFTPEQDVREIYEKAVHRMTYVNQLVIGSKISKRWSVSLLPTYLHRNIVPNVVNQRNGESETNGFFALGGITRLKITQRVAVVGEYFHAFSAFRVNNPDRPYHNHLGLGLEIETGGHVFHLNFTNSAGITPNDFLPRSPEAWKDGAFKFGFNISRVFNVGKSH